MNFQEFAASHGLLIDAIKEGQWARVKTTDKSRKRNGAYKYLGDIGFVQNHATMDGVAIWRSDGRNEKVDKIEWRSRMLANERAERSRHAKASAEAAAILKACVRATHPYLASKGFPDATGMVTEAGELIIPMRDIKDYGVINSVQRIAADGSKFFLPGGKAKGSVFTIAKGARSERWLVEGYATGLSLQRALMDLRRQAEVIVCFSAGNLRYVAPLVKTPAFVMADNDKSGTGLEAAKATGLPFVLPMFEGDDANDQHQKYGLRSLVDLIRDLTPASWPALRTG